VILRVPFPFIYVGKPEEGLKREVREHKPRSGRHNVFLPYTLEDTKESDADPFGYPHKHGLWSFHLYFAPPDSLIAPA